MPLLNSVEAASMTGVTEIRARAARSAAYYMRGRSTVTVLPDHQLRLRTAAELAGRTRGQRGWKVRDRRAGWVPEEAKRLSETARYWAGTLQGVR